MIVKRGYIIIGREQTLLMLGIMAFSLFNIFSRMVTMTSILVS